MLRIHIDPQDGPDREKPPTLWSSGSRHKCAAVVRVVPWYYFLRKVTRASCHRPVVLDREGRLNALAMHFISGPHDRPRFWGSICRPNALAVRSRSLIFATHY